MIARRLSVVNDEPVREVPGSRLRAVPLSPEAFGLPTHGGTSPHSVQLTRLWAPAELGLGTLLSRFVSERVRVAPAIRLTGEPLF